MQIEMTQSEINEFYKIFFETRYVQLASIESEELYTIDRITK